MKTYLITYDLNKEGAAYEKTRGNVVTALKKTGELLHIATTTYVVKTRLTTSGQIFDLAFRPYVDGNDRVIITQMCSDKQGWLSEDQWVFINSGSLCCS